MRETDETDNRRTSWLDRGAYNMAWITVLMVAAVLSPLWSMRSPHLRRWFWQRSRPKPVSHRPSLWVHAVSIGELKIAMNLMKTWDADFRRRVILTTSTPEGMKFARRAADDVTCRFLPWDLTFLYRRLFAGKKPPHLLLVETEIWPNLNAYVSRFGRQVYVINGRLGPRSVKRRAWRLFRNAMAQLGGVLTRSEEDAERFEAFGVPESRIFVTGNIKYDFDTPSVQEPSLKAWLAEHQPLVIFASIANDEIDLLISQVALIRKQLPDLNFLWAPRQLAALDGHIKACEAFSPTRRSALPTQNPGSFLILDTIGELAGCYAAAVVSLVGGSFNRRGGQNFLESLQAGTPALLGPNMENFKDEVATALTYGAVRVLSGAEELAPSLVELVEHETVRAQMAEGARRLLDKHRGAIARTNQTLIDLGIIPPRNRR